MLWHWSLFDALKGHKQLRFFPSFCTMDARLNAGGFDYVGVTLFQFWYFFSSTFGENNDRIGLPMGWMNDFEQCSNQLQLDLISLWVNSFVTRKPIINGGAIRPTCLLLWCTSLLCSSDIYCIISIWEEINILISYHIIWDHLRRWSLVGVFFVISRFPPSMSG